MRRLYALIVVPLLACSSEERSSPAVDSAILELDGSVDEAGDAPTDSVLEAPDVAPDASDASDADSSSCILGESQTESCERCGFRQRLCSDAVTYLGWSVCRNPGDCESGEVATVSCGRCGTKTDTCNAACTWIAGECSGEKTCYAGGIGVGSEGCTAPLARIRTCLAACEWGTWGDCTTARGWFDMAPSGLSRRSGHTAIWTGSEMIVWGGDLAAVSGSAYDPKTDTWSPLPAAPVASRKNHVAVWTGSSMIVWGGEYGTGVQAGASYSKTAGWKAISTTGELSWRKEAVAVWSTTTQEMIVWGGYSTGPLDMPITTYLASGGRYHPATDTWRSMNAGPLAPRAGHRALWNGSRMIVLGGRDGLGMRGEAAAYDPTTDTWTALPSVGARANFAAVAAGATLSDVAYWGGSGPDFTVGAIRNDGAFLDPTTSTTTAMTSPSDAVLEKRSGHLAWWTGSSFFVWGGSAAGGWYLGNGASYDPSTKVWTAMPMANAPSPRTGATAVWTGTEAIVWGGPSSSAEGKLYRP